MSHDQQAAKPAQAPAAAAGGSVGYVAGLAIGLAAVFGLWSLSRTPEEPALAYPAQVAVLVELKGDLTDQQVRIGLSALQGTLKNEGYQAFGPVSCPLVQPTAPRVAEPKDEPVEETPAERAKRRAKLKRQREAGIKSSLSLGRPTRLELASPEAVEVTKGLVERGGYLGRVLSADGRYAVVRGAPKALEPDQARALQEALKGHASSFKGMWVYSRALGLTDPEARGQLNATFGVEVMVIPLVAKDGWFKSQEALETVNAALAELQKLPEVTLAYSAYGFYDYARAAVAKKSPPAADAPYDKLAMLELPLIARKAKVANQIGADGNALSVEIYTTAEGRDWQALKAKVEKALTAIPGVSLRATN